MHKDLPTQVLFVRIMQREYPDLGTCLLVDSSPNLVLKHYHAVFDNHVGWNRCAHVTETLASLGCLNRDYMKIRKFREDLTLRISSIDRRVLGSEAPCPIGLVYDNENHFDPIQRTYGEVLDWFNGISEYLLMLEAFRQILVLQCRVL
jgi:hypothetical protein